MLQLQAITKTYLVGKEKLTVLKGIDLSIKKGEFVALLGASGSGKSTLMNIIGCLDTPTSGNYSINNQDVSTLKEAQLTKIRNKEIGFVFQSFYLIPHLTILENVALPLQYAGFKRSETLTQAKKQLELLGLSDRLSHKPNELSGGQRQRVAIARALVNSPALLLADEPTGNLDSKTSEEVMTIFKELHQAGNTIVLITHEPDIAQHAQRKIYIKDGEMVTKEL